MLGALVVTPAALRGLIQDDPKRSHYQLIRNRVNRNKACQCIRQIKYQAKVVYSLQVYGNLISSRFICLLRGGANWYANMRNSTCFVSEASDRRTSGKNTVFAERTALSNWLGGRQHLLLKCANDRLFA